MIRRPSHVTERASVLKAIDRADHLGREQFREHYGFGPSRSFFLRHNGKTYDSKAIIAVAFGYEHGTKPLALDEFSGGAPTTTPLTRLGFTIVPHDHPSKAPAYTSEWLEVGDIYTRENLRDLFGINDATSNNGLFKPKGHKSVWLFVTRDKTADRPQLHDDLQGDVLQWTGQPAGQRDHYVTGHLSDGNEVLLFYRESVRAFERGGFRYEGPFTYRSHSGSKPAAFLLDRDIDSLAGKRPTEAGSSEAFDPENVADGRAKTLAEVHRRQGQGKFRKDLMKAFGKKCAITGCSIEALLEAAHIHPYKGKATNHVSNGLLLRADLHTLFDMGMIWIEADGTVGAHKGLIGSGYERLGKLRDVTASATPSAKALDWHRRIVANRP